MARDDVPAEDIYNFCYGVFENMDSIKAAHAKGAELNLEFATSVTAVPYHREQRIISQRKGWRCR